MWAWSRRKARGSLTTVRFRLASPLRAIRVARNFGSWVRNMRLRLPKTRVRSLGRNFSFLQSLVWKPALTGAELKAARLVGSEPPPAIAPSLASWPQLVGLTMKFFLLALTSIERMLSLAPP